MRKIVLIGFAALCASLAALTASADVVYQQVISATYGEASGSSNGSSANINISVDDSGTARLITETRTPADGYKLWYGDIPSSTVTVKGINSIAVQIDTCTVDPSAGCGYVDATITMNPKAGGFITNGSTHYTWDDVIVQVAGPIDVRNAIATGYVNGVSLDDGGAYIGKYNTASIEVQTGN
jgi:hypothetical protein